MNPTVGSRRHEPAIRLAGLFFAVGGATAWVAAIFSPSPYRLELMALGTLAFTLAAIVSLLPWDLWPRPMLAVVPALGVLLMVANAAIGLQGPATFAVFVLLIVLWVGFALEERYSIPFAVAGGAAYAIAYPGGSGPSGAIVEGLAIAGVSLIVGGSISRAVRRIRRSEARLRDAQEAGNIGNWEWDPITDAFWASPLLPRLLGSTETELEGSFDRYLARVHPDDREEVRATVDRALESGEPFRCDHRTTTPDGAVRLIECRGRIWPEPGGTSRVVGIAHDVTELREAEKSRQDLESQRKLQESEARYRRFFEEDLTGDFVTSPDGTILECNRALALFFGFETAEELRGQNIIPFYAESDDRDQMLADLRERGKLERHEREFRRRDGKLVTGILNTIADYDEEGNVALLRGYLFDITDRKALEAKFLQAQRMEAIGRLAGGMAHDFNNVLTSIRGHVELILLDTPEDAPVRADLESIQESTERAASLTRQLLAFSRQQVLQPRVLDLSKAVGEMAEMLQHLAGSEVDLRVISSGEPCQVRVDPSQIEQIVMNLTTNARDAMPMGGQLTISVERAEITGSQAKEFPYPVRSGAYVRLAASDTGEGMDSEVRDNVFEPFFTTKPQGSGTGLGLSMVYGIVKQSDGYIWVDSEPRMGTTFSIYLPAIVEMEAEIELPEGGMETPMATRDRSAAILVAEDESAVRSFVCRVLERQGFEVLAAADAREAVTLYEGRGGAVDLLLTDVVMPGMGGRELADRLRAQAPEIRVIFMSGYTEDEVVRRGVRRAEQRFLQKPFSHTELVGAVVAALGAEQ